MTTYAEGGKGWVKADRDVTFLRLLLEAGDADGNAISAAVQKALGLDWRGQQWQVRPLFHLGGGGGSAALARFFEATGAVETRMFDQLAWQLSYALQDSEVFESVRPDLPTGSYQIDEADQEEGIFGGSAGYPPETKAPNYTWALHNIRVPDAWRLDLPAGGRSQGEGVVVGHLDTGYTPHSQLGLDALDLERDWDFMSDPEDADALDPLQRSWVPGASFPGHGTGTGSVIAGRGAGELTGVAPKAVLIPIRAVRSVIEIREGDVARAIHYATAHGAHVISMSLGGLPFSGVKAAVDHAVGQGVIVMAASGNYVPFKTVVWPARYRNCIAVAATDAHDEPWDGSSHGKAIAIAAPGTGVWVARWDLNGPQPVEGGIGQSKGTSHAVAHVAGVAALWLGYHGRENLLGRYGSSLSAVFRQLVAATSRRPSAWDGDKWGPGIIDAAALLAAELPDPSDVEGPDDEAAVEADSPSALDLFPPDVAGRVASRLGNLLGNEAPASGGPMALAESLGRHHDEFFYLLLEKREVRAALNAESDLEAPGPAPDAELRMALRRTASPALLRHVGLA